MNVVKLVIPAVCYSLVAAFTNAPLRAGENAPASPGDNKKTQEPTPAPPPPGGDDGFGRGGISRSVDQGRHQHLRLCPRGLFPRLLAPGSQGPPYIGYNNFKNTVILDKLSLNVERTVDPTKKEFDVGFHVEGIYGADAAFIHSVLTTLTLRISPVWRAAASSGAAWLNTSATSLIRTSR